MFPREGVQPACGLPWQRSLLRGCLDAAGSVSVHGWACLRSVAVPRASGVQGERWFLPRNVGGRQFNCSVLGGYLCFR